MRGIRWDSPVTVYLLTLASALPLGAILAAANPMPEGACSGIGFGCSLYGWDAVALALVVFGLPYAVVLGVALLLLSRHRTAARTVAWVGFVVPWVAGLVVASRL